MNDSVSIIDSIQVIPLGEDEISPLMTKVKIKVFHLGANRNNSYIDKETAISMAKTLRGCPIVGRYREEKGDFTDHGEEIVINDQGYSITSKTKPYGFVDLSAKIWFEDYMDTDEFGNQLQHTYLVTEGRVWTEQYKELQDTICSGGRPQSMELHEETLQGHWGKDPHTYADLFIINDAIISKLCALGSDVEPCFLGASIETSTVFSKEQNEFLHSLLDMKKQFSLILNQSKGGNEMVDEISTVTEEISTQNFSEEMDNNVQSAASEIESNVGEFKKAEEEEKKDETPAKEEEPEKEEESDKKSDDSEEEDEEKKKAATQHTCKEDEEEEKKPETNHTLEEEVEKYELLEKSYNELKAQYDELQTEVTALREFKLQADIKEKDELIDSFYMLSDEDKKDVVENKLTYSLDDIKAKLSIICVDKRVSFAKEEPVAQSETAIPMTYNLNCESELLPAWLKAVEDTRKNN